MLNYFFLNKILSIIIDMGSYEENYLAKRPQELCHMCGRCCRVVTTTKPYSELKMLAANGNKYAVDFLKIFVPYNSIEDARKVDSELVDNVILKLSEDNNYDESKMTFYGCKYLTDENLCSIYEERPELCRHCPATPWSIVPPGCGFEGWLFMKREEDKQKVRKAKEDLLELKLLKQKTNDPDVLKKISSVENKIKHTVEAFKKYGSQNW